MQRRSSKIKPGKKRIIITGFGGTASDTSDEKMVISPAFNEVMNLEKEDLSDKNQNYLQQKARFEKLDFMQSDSILNARAKSVFENMMFNHDAFALKPNVKEFYEDLALRDDTYLLIVSSTPVEFIKAQLMLANIDEKTIENIVIYDVRDMARLGEKAGIVQNFISAIEAEQVASVEVYDGSASDRAAMVEVARAMVDDDVPVSHARALPIPKAEQAVKDEPIVINERPIVTRERSKVVNEPPVVTRERSKRISASDAPRHPFNLFDSKRQRTDVASSSLKMNTFDNITKDISKRMSAEMSGVKKNSGKLGAEASQLMAQYNAIAEYAKMAGRLDKAELKSNDKQQQETLKLQRLNMAIETVRRNLDGAPLSRDNKSAIEAMLDSYSQRVQEQLGSEPPRMKR